MLDQIKRTIIDNGGNLVTKYSAITLDYVIVPLDFDNSITNPLDFDNSITNTTMLVTLYWLESSLFAKRLLDPFEDPLFTPANGFGCRNILSGTTVMVAKERDRSIKLISIEQFLSYLGARVTNKLIDIVPVHVVISDDPNHELARKAKELDVPVVRLKWMFQCAHTNTKLPFADFYTYPSSQYSDSPPASNTSFTSCRSFFECDPTFLDFEDPERYSPPGTTPKTASFDPHNNFGGVIVEKCVEPEMREAWELMDTTQSPSSNDTLLNFDFNVEPADNKGNTSISVDYNTPNFIHGNITHSRGKKRLRSPTTPEYGNPRNRNLFNVVISGPEPNDTDNDTISEPIEEVGQNTQEVFDKFQNILYQELNEAEKQINKPHDKMMIGQNAEFKVSSESLRFSSSIQQKKYLLEHHSKLSHTRAEIIWDPFHSEGYSPLPSSTPDTIGNTFSSSTPEQSHSSEEISSKSQCNTLQRSGSWKADSNSSLKSSLYSSHHPSHIFMFSCIEMELRIRLGEIIKFLGGKYLGELSYDQHCTHLITGEVKSHEKLFCAMAAGLYILKPEYIFQCQSVSKFVEEEPFEWGNPSISKPIRNDKRLLATYWWRKELEERVHKNRSGMFLRKPPKIGVFEGWSVYLGCQNCKVKECKINICKQIISAGRGKTTYTISQRSKLTIAILDLHCISNTNLHSFKKSGMKVVSCHYLIEYLDNLGDEMLLKQFVLQEALP